MEIHSLSEERRIRLQLQERSTEDLIKTRQRFMGHDPFPEKVVKIIEEILATRPNFLRVE